MWHRDPQTFKVAPGDRAFWTGLWQSPQFRACLADPDEPYRWVLERAIARPWWFVPLRTPCEKYHFGAWFGQALGQRTYERPLIHDLYWLHEILHALTFENDPQGSAGQWERRMRANEILVSLETEVLVYARYPDWREHTFAQTIWADRFDLRSAPAQMSTELARAWQRTVPAREHALRHARPSWPLPYPATRDFSSPLALWWRRRQAALTPLSDDAPEHLIAQYEGQATEFFQAWRPHWRQVERDRQHFEAACAAGRWRQAVADRERRWEQVSDAQGLPYGQVAHRFFETVI